ncbi:MAG: MBOAT family protein [Flavobacteriales bacterium]|nr:MBOAT family protein [Flavobacteriales bacterium]
MLFNSFEFLCIFFPLVTGLYFTVPHHRRWMVLLAASCWFYMAFVPVYILILGFTIGVDYFVSIWIERNEGRKRKLLLAASIVANVSVLTFFKYFNFLNESIAAAVRTMGFHYGVPDLGIILPIGLSFHTFQSLSYTIEVYRKHQKAEHRFGIFALYVMFYPQLVAGPIERPGNLLNQINSSTVGVGMRSDFDHDRVVAGLRQMLWGFFKKVVIADRCAVVVDQVYSSPDHYGSLSIALATYLFAVQIYCDFSGYTDIALGAARVMGFNLMVNFRTPYRSANISEFWGRWHISLSSWFRDYLYIPLGGNRVVKWRWYMNLLLVFLLSGLWHGASWTYVIRGGLHGGYLILAIIFAPLTARFSGLIGLDARPELKRALNVFITFQLVSFAWIFFRADSIGVAKELVHRLVSTPIALADLARLYADVPRSMLDLTVVLVVLFMLIDPVYDAWIKGERRIPQGLPGMAFFVALLAGILLFGYFGSTSFIYFQF